MPGEVWKAAQDPHDEEMKKKGPGNLQWVQTSSEILTT